MVSSVEGPGKRQGQGICFFKMFLVGVQMGEDLEPFIIRFLSELLNFCGRRFFLVTRLTTWVNWNWDNF